jgi:hypothetical protein
MENAYRIVFSICYTGPRVGLPHEMGYDHKCDWCGIEIPEEYLHSEHDMNMYSTKDSDYNAAREAYEKRQMEERALLDNQGITLNEESFQSHNLCKIYCASSARSICDCSDARRH